MLLLMLQLFLCPRCVLCVRYLDFTIFTVDNLRYTLDSLQFLTLANTLTVLQTYRQAFSFPQLTLLLSYSDPRNTFLFPGTLLFPETPLFYSDPRNTLILFNQSLSYPH